MFENIGDKLKGLAVFCACVCGIGGILFALIGWGQLEENEVLGLMMIEYGIIAAVTGILGSWPLYGLGESIDLSKQIIKNQQTLSKQLEQARRSIDEKLSSTSTNNTEEKQISTTTNVTEKKPSSTAINKEEKTKKESFQIHPAVSEWKCHKCGAINPVGRFRCSNCENTKI